MRMRRIETWYLANPGPKEFGLFPFVARSGQESIAQGVPWVIPFLVPSASERVLRAV
jgi:hypothetical protein